MKVIKTKQAEKNKIGKKCVAIEYPMEDKDINGSVINLHGRYPDQGRAVNQECKEIAYILEGSGRLIIEGETVDLKEGDMVLIEPKEKYFWKGEMKMFVPCAPAWYPEQHEIVE